MRYYSVELVEGPNGIELVQGEPHFIAISYQPSYAAFPAKIGTMTISVNDNLFNRFKLVCDYHYQKDSGMSFFLEQGVATAPMAANDGWPLSYAQNTVGGPNTFSQADCIENIGLSIYSIGGTTGFVDNPSTVTHSPNWSEQAGIFPWFYLDNMDRQAAAVGSPGAQGPAGAIGPAGPAGPAGPPGATGAGGIIFDVAEIATASGIQQLEQGTACGWQKDSIIARTNGPQYFPPNYSDIGYYSWICGNINYPHQSLAGVYSANDKKIYLAGINQTTGGLINAQALPRNVIGPFDYKPKPLPGTYAWADPTATGSINMPVKIDPRCYFLCNSGCPLDNSTASAIDFKVTPNKDGNFVAEANFLLNINVKTDEFNGTGAKNALEDFALFGQFHNKKIDTTSTQPSSELLGVENFTMINVGMYKKSDASFNNDKHSFGDLLISFSNLEALSQANYRRTIPIADTGAGSQIKLTSGTNYSFPITYRKVVNGVSGEDIYLGLTLFRSPSDITDNDYLGWGNEQYNTLSGAPTPRIIDLSQNLPFEYNIIYEPYDNAAVDGGPVSNWQGIAGFSTNMSISSLM